MGETKDQAVTIQIPQAMRNMKNSILKEPLILIIWIRNDDFMNEEDDEAK